MNMLQSSVLVEVFSSICKACVRRGHTPKRPRKAGSKILITEHPHAVPLPEQVPEIYESEFVSREEQPHKLHVVTRLEKRVIWQERRILNELGLLGPPGVIKVVMNVPSVNKLLWQVKHAVNIRPLKIAGGPIPESVNEFKGGYLSTDGTYTFFAQENILSEKEAPTFARLQELPETPLTPNQMGKFNHEPFYYNYREDS